MKSEFALESSQKTPVRPVLPAAPYMGGKRNLAKRITAMIDTVPHEAYAEPFVGMGGIFFRRSSRPAGEYINDRSRDVATFFRILQRHYTPFMDMLRYQLTTRSDFERLLKVDPVTLTDLERSARFIYLQRTAFGGKVNGRTFGVSYGRPARFDVRRLEPMLQDIFERLAPVNIECLPYAEFMRRLDRPGTLFFIDPPYWDCENDYGEDMFSKADFMALKELLGRTKARFIMTLNDLPETRALFEGFNVETVGVSYSVGSGVSHGKELIISNL